jgi:hypothetical protein
MEDDMRMGQYEEFYASLIHDEHDVLTREDYWRTRDGSTHSRLRYGR